MFYLFCITFSLVNPSTEYTKSIYKYPNDALQSLHQYYESDPSNYLIRLLNTQYTHSNIIWYTEQCQNIYNLYFTSESHLSHELLHQITLNSLQGIQYLHNHGLYHLNIHLHAIVKCGNIYKLTDFQYLSKQLTIHDISYSMINVPVQWMMSDDITTTHWDLVSWSKMIYHLLYFKEFDELNEICYDVSHLHYFEYEPVKKVLTRQQFKRLLGVFEFAMNCELEKNQNANEIMKLDWFTGKDSKCLIQ
eukprot:NODE_828_length_3655_cov_0.833802.p2 type:complete len:248 gc:universal NODE_828_length_3655_cov_0.833802:2634-1891(-)